MTDSRTEVRGRGITLFRVAGIRIALDYSWFIIFVLIFLSLSGAYLPRNYPGYTTASYWIVGLVATLFFFSSIFIHELTHSFMAVRAGIKIPEITFFVFGGVSRLSQEASDPGTELKIALSGPLSSFVLAAVFWGIRAVFGGETHSLFYALFNYLAWINLALGIFNLVPGFPLDGGRVLRALIWWRTGSLNEATRIASGVGKGFGVLLMILGGLEIFSGQLVGGLWFFLIGMFLRGMASAGYQDLVIKQSLEGVDVKEVMITNVVTVPGNLSVSQLVHDYFYHYHFRGFPVVEGGDVVGTVSLGNMKAVPRDEQDRVAVREIMTPLSSNLSISSHDSLSKALTKMMREGVGRLLVFDGGRMVGMLTKAGLLRFLELKNVIGK